MSAQRIDQPHQPEPKEALRGDECPKPPPMALLPAVPLSDSGQPRGNPGRVDVTGIMPEGIRIDPDLTEGHPGYEESGGSEIIPLGRLAGGLHSWRENVLALAPRSPAKLLAGNAHPALAQDLARELHVPLLAAEVGAFADGETRVHVSQDVRDAAVFIVQPTCPPVNDHLMVLALLADAVRAAGAARVMGIVPYFGFARQEQRSRPGDPRSAQVVGRLLGCVGLDHLVTLDLHAPALESALPMPATLLHAEDVFLPRVMSWGIRDLVIVSPDAGGLKRAQRYALALGAPLAVIAKSRPLPDAATPLQVLGEVEGQTCLVVDDMASTGRTLAGAADALRQAGAKEVHAIFTHAVMAPGAAQRLFAARFGKVLTTDSIPLSPDPWLEVVPIAPLLSGAVHFLCGEGVELNRNERG
jgi:ribose-phosphate pyrophosphokinase